MVSLIVLLKNEGYPVKILLERTRGLLYSFRGMKENSFLEFQHLGYWTISNDFVSSLVSGELLISSIGLCSSLLSLSVGFVYPVLFFCFFGTPCGVACR
jgi:hypothetical protein